MDEPGGSRAGGHLPLPPPTRGGPQRDHSDRHPGDENHREGGRDDPGEGGPRVQCGAEQQSEVQQPPGGAEDGEEGAGEQPAASDGEDRGAGVSQQRSQQTRLSDEAAWAIPTTTTIPRQ